MKLCLLIHLFITTACIYVNSTAVTRGEYGLSTSAIAAHSEALSQPLVLNENTCRLCTDKRISRQAICIHCR